MGQKVYKKLQKLQNIMKEYILYSAYVALLNAICLNRDLKWYKDTGTCLHWHISLVYQCFDHHLNLLLNNFITARIMLKLSLL